jgi:hypothetical protein
MQSARLCVAIAVALGVAVALPAAATSSATSNPVVYSANDTAPDTPGGPDVASVTVNDTTDGLVTFQVSMVAGSEQLGRDSFSIYIDSDQNPTTGDLSGAGTDYLLEYDSSEGGGLALFKWDGKSSYTFMDSPSLKGSFVGDNQYFAIAASELGITDGFNFNVAAANGPDASSASAVDSIPETSTNLHYSMQNKAKPAVKLAISDWTLNTPRVGKYYGLALAVKRSDTGALLTSGATITCTLRVGSRTVPALVHRFANVPWHGGGSRMAALCAWHIPAGTVGASTTAKETVTLGTSTVSKTIMHKVGK